MIQDIAPHVLNNHYESPNPLFDAQATLFVIADKTLLIQNIENQVTFPNISYFKFNSSQNSDFTIFEDTEFTFAFNTLENSGLMLTGCRPRFLFRLDNKPYFLTVLEEHSAAQLEKYCEQNKEYLLCTKRYFREATPKTEAFASVTALQLFEWYNQNKFCGRCATTLRHDLKERMLRCPHCGNMIYPKISPAVIIGVVNGDKILLTKYKNGPTTNFALVAGFTEIGETLEETVAREVSEEVGLKVKNIRYYKSQPWAFTDTILAGFYCEVVGDDSICLEEDELSFGKWFSRQAIDVKPMDLGLTNEMILYFKNHPEKF